MKNTIQLNVQSTYLPEQSAQECHRFLWTYEITITNESNNIVQLLNRYWRITDMTGHVEEIRGPGVIGLQPLIKPQKKFTYNSFCQLPTPQGTMEGEYEMQTLEEKRFIIAIPKFILSAPTHISDVFRSRLH
ncbi:MAG: ApaG [uncultured bacterium]|nr:MAG: ApaG [uncultured bacterium]